MTELKQAVNDDARACFKAGLQGVLFSQQSLRVAGLLFVVFLLVYGVFLGGREWYLNIDEIRDYAGSSEAVELYLSNGRWGLAMYRSIFPGLAPMNGVLIAGVWICFALVLQGHLLGLRDFFVRCVYGVVALCGTLLGEHMLFANQADAFGMAIFMSTLAVWQAVEGRGAVAKIGSVLLLAWSFAVYQSLALNVVVLFLGVLYLRAMRNDAVNLRKYCLLMLKVLLPAVLLYAVCSCVAASLPFISTAVSEHVEEYQQARFSAEAYLSGGAAGLVSVAWENLLKLVTLMLGIGLPLLCYTGVVAAVCGICRGWRSSEGSVLRRVCLRALPVVILAAPFLICVLMNADANDPAAVRTYSAAPFACAVLWVALLPSGVRTPWLRYGIVWALVFAVLAAAHDNKNKLKEPCRFYSSLIRDYMLIEYEAARASAANGGGSEPRVLLFGGEDISPFDDFSSHPFVENLHLPTDAERHAYAEQVRELPVWPAPGSVRCVSPNTVIVNYR